MKIYYYNSKSDSAPLGNFGDELNVIIWPKIVGDLLADRSTDWAVLVGVGSIINSRLDNIDGELFVLGSGIGYGEPLVPTPRIHVLATRGLNTANALRVSPSLAVTDSALLLRNFMGAANVAPKRKERPVAFMPHWSSNLSAWRAITNAAGLRFIDPTAGIERVLDEITASTSIITEAMHGAIVADALRVPWIAVRTWPGINVGKWQEWAQSLEIDYQPTNLFFRRLTIKAYSDGPLGRLMQAILARRLAALAQSGAWKLSDELIQAERLARLNQAVTMLRMRLADGPR